MKHEQNITFFMLDQIKIGLVLISSLTLLLIGTLYVRDLVERPNMEQLEARLSDLNQVATDAENKACQLSDHINKQQAIMLPSQGWVKTNKQEL